MATALFVIVPVGLVAFGLAVADLTPTWWFLVSLGCVAAVVGAWMPRWRDFFLAGLAFCLPVGITKALVLVGGIYSPGLELTLPDLCLFGLGGVWLADRVRTRSFPLVPPGGRFVLLALVWAWISTLHAPDALTGFLAGINYSKAAVTYLLVATLVTTKAQVRTLLLAASGGFLLNILMAVAQFVTRSPLHLQGTKLATTGITLAYSGTQNAVAFRPAGLLLHPNPMAAYLVLVIPTALVLGLLGARRVGRWTWGLSLAMVAGGVAALLMTLSRGGWISFAIATLFLAIVGLRRRLISSRQLAALAAIALIGVGAAMAAYPALFYRLTRGDQRSTETRVLMIEQAWKIIGEHPVIGVGLGGYNHAAQEEIPPSFAHVNAGFREAILRGVVHNHYLLTWAEGGLPAIVFLVLLFGSFVFFVPRSPRWHDRTLEAVALGITAGLVGQLVFFNFDHFYFDIIRYTRYAMCGLLAAIVTLRRRTEAEAARPPAPGGWR